MIGGVLAFLLGGGLWIALSSENASPLDSGKSLLGALLAAGFVVALIEGELTWSGLFGLAVGQIGALCALAYWGTDAPAAAPVPLQMLFVLSYCLVAAVGGVAGALVRARITSPRMHAPPDGR